MRHARRRTVSVLCAGSAAFAVAALPALTSSAAAGESPRVMLQDTHPAWAVTVGGGRQAAGGQVRHGARLSEPARSGGPRRGRSLPVSTPGSPSYRHFITPAQFRSQFGPAPDAAAKVSEWLRGAGLKVSALQQNGRYFNVTGFGQQRPEGVRHQAVALPPGGRHVPGTRRSGDGADRRRAATS